MKFRKKLEKFTKYLKEDKSLSDKTVKEYVIALRKFFEWSKSARITSLIIRNYYDSLINESIKKRFRVSIAHYCKLNNQYMTYIKADLKLVASKKQKMKPLTQKEWEKIEEYCKRIREIDFHRNISILYLARFAGLKSGEIEKLTLDCISLKGSIGEVTVRGLNSRKIPICKNTCEALSQYIEYRKTAYTQPKRGPVFVGKRGPLGVAGIERIFSDIGNAIDVKPLNPYRLRYTLECELSRALSLDSVSLILGKKHFTMS